MPINVSFRITVRFFFSIHRSLETSDIYGYSHVWWVLWRLGVEFELYHYIFDVIRSSVKNLHKIEKDKKDTE